VSHPVGQRWLVDAYAGLLLFTTNDSYFPGTSVRAQSPMGTLQAHLSYTITPRMWAAFDATYYAGGQTTVNLIHNDDRMNNSRIGGTLALPLGKRQSIKFAVSTGAVIRFGANFTTFSVGWQTGWVPRPKPPR